MANDHSALRIHASDGDNWACALIVLNPDFTYTSVLADDTLRDRRTSHVGAASGRANNIPAADQLTLSQAASRIKGAWFDEGTTVQENGLHHCSPVEDATGGVDLAELPNNNGNWDLGIALTTVGDTTMRRNFQ